MGVGGQRYAPAALPPGRDPVPIVQEAGWASELVWTGAENLVPTGILSPDRPARSHSLYRLSYPGSPTNWVQNPSLCVGGRGGADSAGKLRSSCCSGAFSCQTEYQTVLLALTVCRPLVCCFE